jgi:2-hydroxychromene-2-carboxylate isomerase
MTLGPPGAPVTIVQFGDYRCTSCAAFARDCQPALIRRWVQAGVVRWVWRDFPCTDCQSFRAAVAARAAGTQGKFWAFHDYLLTCQPSGEPAGLLTDAYLESVAKRIGLDMAAFTRDLASPALAAAVQADSAFGRQSGVPRTPAFLINGRPLVGARPLPAFETAIAEARAGSTLRADAFPGGVPGSVSLRSTLVVSSRSARSFTGTGRRSGQTVAAYHIPPGRGRWEAAWWKESRRWRTWRGSRTPVRGMPGTRRQESSTGPRRARRAPGRRGARVTAEHA